MRRRWTGAAIAWAVVAALVGCGGGASFGDDVEGAGEDAADIEPDGEIHEADAEADGRDEASGTLPDGFAEGDGLTEVDDDAEVSADVGDCRPWLGGPCNVVDQCGCPSGMRCVLDYSGGPRPTELCVADGGDPPGAVCDEGVDDCVAGSQCGTDTGDVVVCIPYCRSDWNCPGGWRCGYYVPGLTPDDDYTRCTGPADSCDPFTAEGCGEGEACVAYAEGESCLPADPVGPGEPCSYSCRSGSMCFSFGGPPSDSVCVKFCRLPSGLPDCSDVEGAVCVAGLGRADVGICVVL